MFVDFQRPLVQHMEEALYILKAYFTYIYQYMFLRSECHLNQNVFHTQLDVGSNSSRRIALTHCFLISAALRKENVPVEVHLSGSWHNLTCISGHNSVKAYETICEVSSTVIYFLSLEPTLFKV